MLSPAVVVVLSIALLPLGATFWQSLFIIDLRMPWNDSQAPTLDNYETLLNDSRLWGSLGRTLFFVTVSVSAELALGLMLALALHRQKERLGVLSSLILLPWAIPTVVAGLVFRFLFDGPDALANVLSQKGGLSTAPLAWLTEEALAWVPIILADVWKTTPFVTLLLLAALASIDRRLYEAAEVDGALGWHQFRYITLPQLKSTLLVVLLFRVLDALRVFDLIYVLTHGGPGTATEPLALYTFTTLFSHLKFGQGAALSMISVALAAGFALGIVALMRQERQR
jgi:ABC-type sugar transport system permease subunit